MAGRATSSKPAARGSEAAGGFGPISRTMPRRPEPSGGRARFAGRRTLLVLFVVAAVLRAEPEPEREPFEPVPPPTPRAKGEEKRLVIALLDRRTFPEGSIDTDDPVHQLVEMPLNFLGVHVRRHVIQDGPPPEAWNQDARAVVTYFDGDHPAPDWLWPWLEARRGRMRFVHLADYGPLVAGEEGPERLARWLAGFGLEHDDEYAEGPLAVGSRLRSEALCAYEADPRTKPVHRGPRNVAGENTVWVETWRKSRPDERRAPVVTGPWGALALGPWFVRLGAGDGTRRWHVDPFAFFREALGLEGVPAPDPSVLFGRRMFFLHIDGDGFESLSTVRPGSPYCGRVMVEEIFDRYDLPWTVSIIVRSLTRDRLVEEPTDRMLLAREIFARPDVEIASHGVLHPLKWQRPMTAQTPPRTVAWYRKLENYEYGPVNEVRRSVEFINERLCPPGRKCRVMLWTGDAIPPRPALDECARVGCLNMNGGIFRWDALHDSVGYVAPWSRRLGDSIQIYPGAPNENVYEGFFDTMPGAFGHVDTTIERTGAPRILKPANLYIHFYSVETPARTAALQRLVTRWGVEEETAPVFASVFIEAVRDAILGAHYRRTENGWRFRAFGRCRTVRLDGETRGVDFTRSRGLAGARRMNGALYLHLATSDAEVVLAQDPPRRPHVEQANHLLRDVALTRDGVSFRSAAWSRRVVVVAGFASGEEVDVAGERRRADARGRVTFEAKPGRDRVSVRRVAGR